MMNSLLKLRKQLTNRGSSHELFGVLVVVQVNALLVQVNAFVVLVDALVVQVITFLDHQTQVAVKISSARLASMTIL